METESPITVVLSRVARGEPGAAEALLPLVYDDLKRLAAAQIRKLGSGQTLCTTALVHEAWLRLGGSQQPTVEGRAYFFGAAAKAMRRILVEQARHKSRLKRNAGQRPESLPSELAAPELSPAVDMLALDEALTNLGRDYERPARVVMLRYFAGLEMKEIAMLLQISDRTLDREWLFARTWLRRFLDVG